MGCSQSKLGDDEAVQICKDRKRFIKQAVEQRTNFASNHIAYIHSLRKVSDALREYIEGDEPHEFLLDTFVTPVKRTSSSGGFIELSSPSSKLIQSKIVESELEVNYLMASGSRPVLVEEKPPRSPETFHVETYGADSFFGTNLKPAEDNSIPQNSQWDFFWNPFTSLDSYGYSYDNRSGMEDEIKRLRRVREEEGIPDLEEDEYVRFDEDHNMKETYDLDGASKTDQEDVNEQFKNCTGSQERQSIEVSRGGTTGHHVVTTRDDAKGGETPGYTVYLNQRPTSMAQVIKDLEDQFGIICNTAKEVSGLLEASRAQYTTTSNELSGKDLYNLVCFLTTLYKMDACSESFLLLQP